MTLNPKPYFVSIRICIGLDLDLRHVLAMFGRALELPLLRGIRRILGMGWFS